MEVDERRLVKWFSALDEVGREQLLAFAEFLHGRHAVVSPAVPMEPVAIPRPAGESVVAAIRRLAESFPMIDRAEMLNETSMLMSQHVIQGRTAAEVIDDLERLFHGRYEAWREVLEGEG